MNAENIRTILVIGGGTMGQGISQSFAQAGLSVSVVDVDRDRLNECLAQVDANLKLFQEFSLLQEDISLIESRIHPVLIKDLNKALKSCDFVVETIPENLQLKKELFAQLDSCRDEVILSTNTGSLTISEIVEGLRTASRVIGLHYFNPAHIMPLVEIHYGPRTKEEVIATTKALMLKVGKKPIVVRKEIPGLVINRIQSAVTREIDYLIENSVVSPEEIDMATKACYGFRWACIGNIESMDMIGLDVVLAGSGKIYKSLSNSTVPSHLVAEKVKKGELGIKSGRGMYDYAGKSRGEILDKLNKRLLKQLALFKSLEKQDG
jgi:3-hydroxybutyryl-CoA dehydrogenase